ncbi:splicing factor u2af-associated protein 2 [Mucor lusitanicus]
MASTNKTDFASDPRMTLNEQTGKWSYVGEEGVSYEYDENVGAWFPMYDEKLMQAQASVYAIEGVEETVEVKPKEKKKRAATYDVTDPEVQQKKVKRDPPKKPVTSVYVTGIPPDATVEELKTTFSKCGVIMEDLETGDPKIKIYRDENGVSKGDALVSYFKEESVPLAVDLLDEAELRPGDSSTKMNVQKAVFKEKEPVEKKKSTTGKLKAKKKIQQLQRKFDWVEEEGGKKQEKFSKIVILKNMYTQEELDTDPTLLLELKEDVREECEKLGEVTNVILYDKSPGGIISVRYKEKESADACIALMDKRFFGGRQISAEVFDGKTKYEKSGGKLTEEEEEAERLRLERYAKWLEEGGDDGDKTP